MSHARSARARSVFLLAALVAVFFAAFFVASFGGSLAEAKRGKSPKAPAAGAADCKVDKDCVLVADDCCSCSEGGKARAIPKKAQAGYEKERRARCKGTMCTEVMSQDATCAQRPFCGAGICELGEPGSDAAP